MEELNVIKQAIEIAVKAGVYAMADVVVLSQILDKLETKLKENADD
jgi:ribonuclease D